MLKLREISASIVDAEIDNTNCNVEKEKVWNPPHGQAVQSIRPYLLHLGFLRPIIPNTNNVPIEFSNGFFEGKALIVINKKSLRKDYTFEVQIQGRFLEVPPKGKFFVGAEVTKPMKLGFFARGIGNSVLELGRSINPHMHFSFGDEHNIELPHITAPLWSSVHKLSIDDANSSLPILGEAFPEDEKHRIQRMKTPTFHVPIRTDLVYSFSMRSTHIELDSWTAINLPLGSGMDLHSFWGNANLRLVVYYIPDDVIDSSKLNSKGLLSCHPQELLQYWFALEIRHMSNLKCSTTNSIMNDNANICEEEKKLT
mmetsp:Transcript_17248/g.24990  ORF Transcript_17248/g.24990 Transcript_17248/m.24990 type:complete len:312 (-) Transcript_17248:60-995(-)